MWSLVGADQLAARGDRQGNWAMENLNSRLGSRGNGLPPNSSVLLGNLEA